MKYFVTGATGFIGSILTRRLLQEGHTVSALVRPGSLHKTYKHDKLFWCEGDLQDPESLENAMEDCERVFHVAAYASVWAPDSDQFYDVNVLGTRNVLDVAQQLEIERLVYTSTAATLPPSLDDAEVDETATKMHFFSPYEHTKYLAEQEVQEASEKSLDAVIVQPTRVFGPGLLTESNSVTKIIKWYVEGKWRFLPGNGKAIGNYCYVRDVVDGHLKAMQHAAPGEKYILGGENLSFSELFSKIGKAAGKKRKLIPLPTLLMKSVAAVEQLRAELFQAHPLITLEWMNKYLYNWRMSSAKAQKELGYEITPFQDAVRKTIRWLQQEKHKSSKLH